MGRILKSFGRVVKRALALGGRVVNEDREGGPESSLPRSEPENGRPEACRASKLGPNRAGRGPSAGRRARSKQSATGKPRRRGPKPVEVHLARGQRRTLQRDVRQRAQPARAVIRARIILELEQDPCVSAVAAKMSLARKTVRTWRDRYLSHGRRGLGSRPKSGRPTEIDDVSRCHLLAMGCGKPKDFEVAYRESWTLDVMLSTFRSRYPDLADFSRGSAWRTLHQVDLRPHKVKMWLHSPDPKFREKVTDVCRCYQSPEPGHIYLCVDEKTGMQALGRKHPSKPAAPGRWARFEYEYIRNGTRTLIAAFNPHTGHVFGQVKATRKAHDLVEYMEALAQEYPTGEVHIIWDNLNIHHEGPSKRWTAFNQRHGGRFHFHYTPIHASWVNQVELFFGVLHKRLLRGCVYNSVEEIEQTVMGFLSHWNQNEAHPFRWTFKGYPLQMAQADKAAA